MSIRIDQPERALRLWRMVNRNPCLGATRMLGNIFGLKIRDGENHTAFAARLMRAEFMEEAAKIVETEMVTILPSPPDPTDLAYNLAITHAAEAIRRAIG